MSKVNATAHRLPSGQGIGFWITLGSFVGRNSLARRRVGRDASSVPEAIVPRAATGRQSRHPGMAQPNG
jgi:hypothetical protein